MTPGFTTIGGHVVPVPLGGSIVPVIRIEKKTRRKKKLIEPIFYTLSEPSPVPPMMTIVEEVVENRTTQHEKELEAMKIKLRSDRWAIGILILVAIALAWKVFHG